MKPICTMVNTGCCYPKIRCDAAPSAPKPGEQRNEETEQRRRKTSRLSGRTSVKISAAGATVIDLVFESVPPHRTGRKCIIAAYRRRFLVFVDVYVRLTICSPWNSAAAARRLSNVIIRIAEAEMASAICNASRVRREMDSVDSNIRSASR